MENLAHVSETQVTNLEYQDLQIKFSNTVDNEKS